jgi:hypothetical protein
MPQVRDRQYYISQKQGRLQDIATAKRIESMVEHSAEEFAFNDEQDYFENVSHLEEYKQPAKMTSN